MTSLIFGIVGTIGLGMLLPPLGVAYFVLWAVCAASKGLE